MKLRTYQARSMADCLAKVKRDLGRDAVILHTRTFRKGGLFGMGGRQMVEITAARQLNLLHPAARRTMMQSMGRRQPRQAEGAAVAVGSSPGKDDRLVAGLRQEIGLVRSLVQELLSESRRVHRPSVPQELYQTYLRLIQQEVAEELADQLVQQLRGELSLQQLRDPAAVHNRLASYIESMIPAAGPLEAGRAGQARVVALVGPTGVGKTTTIAKLAANFKLREGRSVGLITIDTYRIAAVDQLRTYAQIIDVPLQVVLSPTEFGDAVESLAGLELVLIDTAGRSQNDTIKLNELKRFFERRRPDEVHLVLASTCTQKALLSAVERFGRLGIDRIIFTKLDEAVGFGVILGLIKRVDAKLSYVTTGQDVPDDIEVGSPRRLAQLILGGQDVGGRATAKVS